MSYQPRAPQHLVTVEQRIDDALALHSPIFDELHRTERIVRGDILHGSSTLADDTMAGRAVDIGDRD